MRPLLRGLTAATALAVLAPSVVLLASPASAAVTVDLVPIASYDSSSGNVEGGAEIVAFDPASRRSFTTNDPVATPTVTMIDVVDLTAPSLPARLPSIDLTPLGASTIVATGSSGVTVTAPPGSTVELLAYTRPSTAFRVVRSAQVGSSGAADFRIVPPANTRLYAQVRGCAGDPARSVVLNVRTALSLFATRNRPRDYTFSGDSVPARPGGLIVSLYRVTADGRQVLTSQTRASAATGDWMISRRFTGVGRFGFVVRTGQDLQNAPGASTTRPTLIF